MPSVEPVQSPSPSPAAGELVIGSTAVTVSDRVRVRSKPGVSEDSVKYTPLLPIGTELQVVGGPVTASDYVWWEVEPVSLSLDGAIRGWVAIADHDGTPWVASANEQIAGLASARSSVARARADPAAARTAAASINAFAVDAYKQLLRDKALGLAKKNTVFSPASIALALGMVRPGAKGETAAQMDTVLHTAGWSEFGAGLNALDQALVKRNVTWRDGEATQKVALRIANTTFGQHDWSIEPTFLDAIGSAFGAGLNLVDYIADPQAARKTINSWVSRQTERRIPELLQSPDVTADTRLYLVNAIYLKAEWEDLFDEERTTRRSFTRLDGSRVKVPTMATTRGGLGPITPYASGRGWKAVELRYKAPQGVGPLAMVLIRPDDLRAFEKGLTAKRLAQIVAALDRQRSGWDKIDCPRSFEAGCYPYNLTLYMPKFGIETRAGLGDLLKSLGMGIALNPARADFTGIHRPASPSDRIFIGAVVHQANIDVDEKGTEAAAATAVGFTGGGPSPLKSITLRLDRPFIFLLRDVETGAILFMGRVVDPSAGR